MTHWTNVPSKTLAALLAWLGAVSCVTPLFAQIDNGIAPKTDRQPRPGRVLLGDPSEPTKTAANTGSAIAPGTPTNQQLKAAVPPNFKISPELENLLVAWEKQSQGIQRLSGSFRLWTYDEVFQVETRGVGKFWYASPDKGRMDFEPADLSKCPVDKATGKFINPRMPGPNGSPYEVKKRNLEIWNCTGSEILQIFPTEKRYSRITIPQQYQGASIKESPLPFLFGLKRDEAKDRYLMTLGEKNGQPVMSKVPSIHVIAYPLREQDSREWSKAEVLLDSQTFLPQSIQTFDPAGTGRNVYAFADVEVNARWMFKDPFSVPLTGLTLTLEESAKPQQGSTVPGGIAPKPPVKGAGPLK